MTTNDLRRTLGDVLVPTDFSDGPRFAIDRAARLPLGIGASVGLLHVLPDDFDEGSAKQADAGEKRRTEQLRDTARRALDAAGNEDRDVFVSVVRGQPFVEITRHARHGRAELIVVGRHGERTFRDLLIGTTAERVIRKGDVSVLIVSKPPEGNYRRPLVAVDMSDSSRLALELALRICDPAVEKIDVVHVVALAHSVYVTEVAPIPDSRVENVQRANSELSEFLGKIGSHAHWNVILKTGEPRQAILDEAMARNSDLIAVGTRGRTGLPLSSSGALRRDCFGPLRATSSWPACLGLTSAFRKGHGR